MCLKEAVQQFFLVLEVDLLKLKFCKESKGVLRFSPNTMQPSQPMVKSYSFVGQQAIVVTIATVTQRPPF